MVLGQVQTAMQRGHGAIDEVADERKMQDVDVKMQNVELVRDRAHLIEHHDMVGDRILDARIQTQGGLAERLEPGRRAGVAAGEQSHVVALPDQLLRQVGDDPFRAPIEPRRAALEERSDLGNLHRRILPGRRPTGGWASFLNT